ncbi:MAG: DUF1553 domain-containing protein [Kiritimatiellae bacterium]|nr:DUF1553 domain-containing protein [Kiritimatiellia bacterium]
MRPALAVFMISYCAAASGATAQRPPAAALYQENRAAAPENAIDKLVFRGLAQNNITPAYCTDAVFLRRAYLDAIGTLPSADEARAFLNDPSLNKRRALVERLLERGEFADYWAMKWSDILRVKAEFPVNLWPNAAQAYHRWLRASLSANKPYDRFARELLTSNGSNFRVGPVNFFRAMPDRSPEGIASAVAQTFLGMRTDRWSAGEVAGLAAFFTQVGYKPTREWKEEVVFWDPRMNACDNELEGTLPGNARLALPPDRDPREIFADWLTAPDNRWFSACIVNRVWAWLLGRGIIHEPDDIRPDNPPSNPALLALLQRELLQSGYDLKRLYRLIMNSRTYQLSSIFPADKLEKAAPLFACYPLRQLDAEVLIDAVNKITGATDLYTSAIPEPFTFIPANKPAVALPDGSITSPFLELFGRPARATGLLNERVNRPSASQRMHLLNSSHIQNKLANGPNMRRLLNPKRKPSEMIEDIFLAALSRYPTPAESAKVEAYFRSGVAKGRDAGIDLAWALINSDEFLFRH